MKFLAIEMVIGLPYFEIVSTKTGTLVVRPLTQC